MTYFLDTIDGDDANDGESEGNAVKTMVRALALVSGDDNILEKVGDDAAERWAAIHVGSLSHV